MFRLFGNRRSSRTFQPKGLLDIKVIESLIQIPAVALLGGRPGDGDSAEEDVGRLGKASPTLLHHPGAAVLAWFTI